MCQEPYFSGPTGTTHCVALKFTLVRGQGYWRTQTSVWLLGADWFLNNAVSLAATWHWPKGLSPETCLRGLQPEAMTGFSQLRVNSALRYTHTVNCVTEVTGWVVKLTWEKSSTVEQEQKFTKLLLSSWSLTRCFMINSFTTLLGNSRKHPLLWEKCILCSWITIWQCWHLRVFFWKYTFGLEWLVSLKWVPESTLGFYFKSVVMTDMGYQNYGNNDVCQILQMTILSSSVSLQ